MFSAVQSRTSKPLAELCMNQTSVSSGKTGNNCVDPVAFFSGEFALMDMEHLFLALKLSGDIYYIIGRSGREAHQPLPHPGLQDRPFRGFPGRAVIAVAKAGRIEGIKAKNIFRFVLK